MRLLSAGGPLCCRGKASRREDTAGALQEAASGDYLLGCTAHGAQNATKCTKTDQPQRAQRALWVFWVIRRDEAHKTLVIFVCFVAVVFVCLVAER
jgi:hypothetical protein